MSEILLKNPLTIWLRWLVTVIYYKIKNAGKNLKLEYGVELKRTSFSDYNAIYKYARIRDATFGKCSYVGRDSQVYNAKIGAFTSIGPEVWIGLGEHPSSEFVSTHPIFYSTIGQSNPVIVLQNLFEEYAETVIGNDVWIGARSIIRAGVKIGNGAIIAAGSIVTKDVEAYSVVGGVPAKIIRYRFEKEDIAFLEELQWWTKDFDWIKERKSQFLLVGDLKEKMQRPVG